MNLLTAEILAEVTLHVLNNGQRKAIISKIEEGPENTIHQQLVQHLLFTAIEIAQSRGIFIAWPMLEQKYPWPKPAAGSPAPPPAPGG